MTLSAPAPDSGIEAYPIWLAPCGAAKYCSIKQRTLAALRTRGGGPRYAKRGRSILYRISDLEAWLLAARVGDTAEANARQIASRAPRKAGAA